MNTRRLTEVERLANEALDRRIEAVLVKLRPIQEKYTALLKVDAVEFIPEFSELIGVVCNKYDAGVFEGCTETQTELLFCWLSLHPGA